MDSKYGGFAIRFTIQTASYLTPPSRVSCLGDRAEEVAQSQSGEIGR